MAIAANSARRWAGAKGSELELRGQELSFRELQVRLHAVVSVSERARVAAVRTAPVI